MSKRYYVARTAAGLSHGNTLVLRKQATVIVYLDMPHRPADMQDRFRLISDDGHSDRTLLRSEAVAKEEGHMTLLFTEVPPLGTYSLYHGLTKEIEIPVLMDVLFADLASCGEDAVAITRDKAENVVRDARPVPESDDALLNDHAADYALDDSEYLDLIAFRTASDGNDSAIA